LLIQRITLDQLTVWHSSGAGGGGIRPGAVWLDERRAKLKESLAVITLLTPNSLRTPWLLFESGFGAASDQCEIIPICIGIDQMDTVPFPLAIYQCYFLSDYDSVKAFCRKLLVRHNIRFDEEMAKPLIRKAIGELVKARWNNTTAAVSNVPDLATLRDELKSHIDRRFLDIFNHSSDRQNMKSGRTVFVSYTVPMFLDFPGLGSTNHLQIEEFTTIQSVTNSVCAMVYDYVGDHSYLEKWIIKEQKTGRNLVIREFQSKIAAHPIMRPGTA
jgi:hypothetical protein